MVDKGPVGYVWPNGERGSGKTQCLKTLMSVSFMGQTVTSGSTFATVRDEAALGATIGFDDCENVRKMDSEKRELLLAGNTRGAGFMFKEPGKRDGTWNTRYIDCFAPRAFTSISLPDEVLASRTIVIPLVQTGDVETTRRKPTNLKDWGLAPQHFRDVFWLWVSRELLQIEGLKDEINKGSSISGRGFDIFQPMLTIALWLERNHGIDGLYKRMSSVMDAYHAAKHKTLLPSFEHVTLQALKNLLSESGAPSGSFKTLQISNEIATVCSDMDITDPELTSRDVQKTGMLLSRMGFPKAKTHGRARSWDVSNRMVDEKARVAGIELDALPAKQIEKIRDLHSEWPASEAAKEEAPW